MNATATVSGIELWATNLGLPQTPDWYAFYFDRYIDAGALGTFVETESVETVITNLGLPESPDWYAWYTERDLIARGDASVELRGIQASASAFDVTANVQNDEILRLSGNPRRYSVQIKNAKLNLQGIEAKMSTSKLEANGTSVISNVVRLNVVFASISAENVTANGILDISEEELTIFLMAA